MNLTSTDIEQAFFDLLSGSAMDIEISGEVYKSGMRPIGSEMEDVVISFLAGISNQVQTGIVNINCYVPDTTMNGSFVKNTARIKELESELNQWLESQKDNADLKIELDKTVKVFKEEEIKQHFINMRLSFKILIQ